MFIFTSIVVKDKKDMHSNLKNNMNILIEAPKIISLNSYFVKEKNRLLSF